MATRPYAKAENTSTIHGTISIFYTFLWDISTLFFNSSVHGVSYQKWFTFGSFFFAW
jgi:hypothetical protein